ncbi:uncharacterized protein LOC127832188 [Dreissena polymorpha]|uniref:uncharacterized protein LOC127832188 n=1 Tax=Dreissena polymorpha TaxID=45954 RepID=UPI0022643163|nr:uncharacterized protein LOC127832188 [Dreissena polymorpha]
MQPSYSVSLWTQSAFYCTLYGDSEDGRSVTIDSELLRHALYVGKWRHSVENYNSSGAEGLTNDFYKDHVIIHEDPGVLPGSICSIVGYRNRQSSFHLSATCNRGHIKELPALSPQKTIQVLESDLAHDLTNDLKVSQDGITCLNIMKDNVLQREDKHLEMTLQFKERPILPNNRSAAVIWLSHRKGKLSRDDEYHGNNKVFMNKIIKRGDAEFVQETSESKCNAHAHQNIQYQGRGFTLNKLQSIGYWVVGGSKVVANDI